MAVRLDLICASFTLDQPPSRPILVLTLAPLSSVIVMERAKEVDVEASLVVSDGFHAGSTLQLGRGPDGKPKATLIRPQNPRAFVSSIRYDELSLYCVPPRGFISDDLVCVCQ